MAKNAAISKDNISAPRIKRSGDLLRMDTNPTVPKALGMIQVKELKGELTAQDKKAFNWLLHNAFDEISEDKVHTAKASELRSYLSKHESNDRLIETTMRLGTVPLAYNYLDEDGVPDWGSGSMISISGSIKNDTIKYSFPHWLRPMLAEPAKWARLSLSVMQKFNSKYSVALYENLELYTNRRTPKMDVSIEDLRVIIGVPDDKLQRFNDLKKRAIDPALAEINQFADFTATYEVSEKIGRKVSKICFTITKKDKRQLVEALTQQNQGYVPPPPLNPETFTRARKHAAGGDIYEIEKEWRNWSNEQGKPIRNPDGDFINFVKRWTKNRQGKLLY
jgi:hypothetical protein